MRRSLQQALTSGFVMMGNTTRMSFKHSDTRGDMESVEDMFGLRGDQLGQRSDLVTAVGQEGDILIGLQALAIHYVEQPALRLAIVPMHRADLALVTVFGHRLADDDLEIALPVFPVADIAAIEAHRAVTPST